MEELSEENIIKWSEGNKLLEQAIRNSYKNGIKTCFSCAGHGEKTYPYLSYEIEEKDKEKLERMFSIYSETFKDSNIVCKIKKRKIKEKAFLNISFHTAYFNRDKLFKILKEKINERISFEELEKDIKNNLLAIKKLLSNEIKFSIETGIKLKNGIKIYRIFLYEKNKYFEELGFKKENEFEFKEENIYQARLEIDEEKLFKKLNI